MHSSGRPQKAGVSVRSFSLRIHQKPLRTFGGSTSSHSFTRGAPDPLGHCVAGSSLQMRSELALTRRREANFRATKGTEICRCLQFRTFLLTRTDYFLWKSTSKLPLISKPTNSDQTRRKPYNHSTRRAGFPTRIPNQPSDPEPAVNRP